MLSPELKVSASQRLSHVLDWTRGSRRRQVRRRSFPPVPTTAAPSSPSMAMRQGSQAQPAQVSRRRSPRRRLRARPSTRLISITIPGGFEANPSTFRCRRTQIAVAAGDVRGRPAQRRRHGRAATMAGKFTTASSIACATRPCSNGWRTAAHVQNARFPAGRPAGRKPHRPRAGTRARADALQEPLAVSLPRRATVCKWSATGRSVALVTQWGQRRRVPGPSHPGLEEGGAGRRSRADGQRCRLQGGPRASSST